MSTKLKNIIQKAYQQKPTKSVININVKRQIINKDFNMLKGGRR